MNRMILGSFIVLAAVVAPAQASEWVTLANTVAGPIYVDADSIKPMGKHLRVWTYQQFAEPQTINGLKFQSMRQLDAVSCEEETRGVRTQAYYADGDGTAPVGDTYQNPNYAMDPVVPGTVGSSLVRFVCDKSFRQRTVEFHRRHNR